MKSREKGITLIALVVTVIVLMILVGVSMNELISKDLINTAEEAIDSADEQASNMMEQTNQIINEWQEIEGTPTKSSTNI